MKLFHIIIALLTLTLMMSPMVSGELVINRYTNDFVLSSPNNEQLKLCSCETRVDTVIVENIGHFTAGFSLWIESDWPGSATLAETTFTLNPKEIREVPVYIADSCNLEGIFSYTVHAQNSFGRDESLSRTIRSDSCQATRLEVSEDVSVSMCQPATFEVSVTNVGRHTETYRLDVSHEGAIPAPDMYLDPDETITQNVTFQWDCQDFEKKTVDFTVTAEKQGSQEMATRHVTITNDYAFGLDMKTQIDVCALKSTRVPITVANMVDVPEDIRLSLNAAPFVTFSGERSKTVSLDPNEERELTLDINPVQPGKYSVTIDARDVYGGTTKSRTADLIVSNCYDYDVEVRVDPEQTFEGTDLDCCGMKTYYVNVFNKADREQVFNLDVDGPTFFLLEERTVRVQPSQSINVKLFADLPCSDELYGATVHVSPVDQSDLVRSASVGVTSLTPRSCNMVQVDEDELEVTHNQTEVPILVRHTGIRGGTYGVTSNSDDFTFTEEEVTLYPGEERELTLTIDAEKGRHLVFPTFTTEEGLQYNEFVGLNVKGMSLWEQFTNWLSSISFSEWSGCAGRVLFLFVIFLLLVVLLFMVWGGSLTLMAEGLPVRTLGLLRSILVFAMIVLVILFLLLPQPSRESRFEISGDETVFSMYQNEPLTVDLDKYFDDPDMDFLTYAATQPRNIQVDIDGNMLTLTPDLGFSGEDTIVLEASDGKSVTESPQLTLLVAPAKDLSLAAWCSVWCSQLVVLNLLLILLVIFLFVLGIKEKRQDLKSKNMVVVVPLRKKSTRKSAKKRKKAKTRKKSTRKSSKKTRRKAVKKSKRKTPKRKAVKKSTRKASKKRKKSKRKAVKKSTRKSTKKVSKAKPRKVKGQIVPVKVPTKKKKSSSRTVNIQVNIDQ